MFNIISEIYIKLLFLYPILAFLSIKFFNKPVDLFYKAILILIVPILLLKRKNKIFISKMIIPLILYTIYIFFWSNYNGEIEEKGIIKYIINDNNLFFIIILILIDNLKIDTYFIKKLQKYISVTILISFLVTLIQIFYDPIFFVPDSFIESQYSNLNYTIYTVRRISIYGYIEHNAIGFSFLPLFAVYIGYKLWLNRKIKISWIIIGGIISIATNARYIIGGYFISILQIFKKQKIKIKNILLLIISIILILLFLKKIGYNFNDYLSKRLNPDVSIQEGSRYISFMVFIKYFPRNILFGTGVLLTNDIERDLAGKASAIHIGYLSHLVSYGIVGSILLFTFWFLLFKKLREVAIITGYYGSYITLLIFLWSNLSLIHYSMFTYGIIISLIYNKYFENNYKTNKINLK